MNPDFEQKSVLLREGSKVYFSSDYHLGVPSAAKSLEREKLIIRWLESIQHDAQIIFLVGDIFDFWFEYGHVVPKGFVRILGKLAELTDRGIELVIFTGNHDMWMFGYLTTEIGATIYRNPVQFTFEKQGCVARTLLVGHGDGLGPGDRVYKILKRVFSNPFFQMLFRIVHPDIGMWIASQWSQRSRAASTSKGEERFMGDDKEWLLQYCREVENQKHNDFYVFGHRHLPLDLKVNDVSRYVNLGEWISQQTYAEFDGEHLLLKTFR